MSKTKAQQAKAIAQELEGPAFEIVEKLKALGLSENEILEQVKRAVTLVTVEAFC